MASLQGVFLTTYCPTDTYGVLGNSVVAAFRFIRSVEWAYAFMVSEDRNIIIGGIKFSPIAFYNIGIIIQFVTTI